VSGIAFRHAVRAARLKNALRRLLERRLKPFFIAIASARLKRLRKNSSSGRKRSCRKDYDAACAAVKEGPSWQDTIHAALKAPLFHATQYLRSARQPSTESGFSSESEFFRSL
jgi:hypothetical protein